MSTLSPNALQIMASAAGTADDFLGGKFVVLVNSAVCERTDWVIKTQYHGKRGKKGKTKKDWHK